MKKIFILCFAIVAICTNTNAQYYGFCDWTEVYLEADELKGKKERYSNAYVKDNGDFFACFSDDKYVIIKTQDGFFNYNYEYNNFVVDVTIGFYKDNILIEKDVVHFRTMSESGYSNVAFSYIGDGKKIIKHLKYIGDVRIIAPKYGDKDFDITIPMNPNIRTNIQTYTNNTVTISTDNKKTVSNNNTVTPHQLVEKFYNIKNQIKSNKKLAKQLVKNSTEYNQMLSNIKKLKAEQKDIEIKYYEITNYSIYQHDKYLLNH